jgi:hypothetical protein
LVHGHGNVQGYACAESDPHTKSNTNSNANIYTFSDTNSNSYANSHSNSHSNSYTHPDAHSFPGYSGSSDLARAKRIPC